MAAKVAVLATTLIAAKVLTPSDFGRFVALQATAIFAAAVWDLGVSTLITREVARGNLTPLRAIAEAWRLRIRTLALWIAVLSVGFMLFGGHVSQLTLAIFVVFSLVVGLHSVTLAGLRGTLNFRAVSVTTATGRWLAALIALLLISTGFQHLNALELVGVALVAGELIVLIRSLFLWLSKPGASGNAKTRVLSLRKASPFAANTVMAIAYNRLDVLIVAALTSANQLGAYAVASRVQDVLYMFPAVVGAVAMPALARTWSSVRPDLGVQVTNKLLGYGFVIGLIIAGATFLTAPVFIPLALGPEYNEAIWPIRILCWFLPLAMIQAPLLSALAASNRETETSKIILVTLVTAVIFHLSLDWWAGAQGAALASIARDLVAAPLAIFFAARAGLISFKLPSIQRFKSFPEGL